MHHAELIDGLKLVAEAAENDAIRPRAGVSGFVWLDLSGLTRDVAFARVRSVVRFLTPCLLVDEATRLVIGGDGSFPAPLVAATAAQAIAESQRGQLRLATIRGEQVLDRLEEFVGEGVAFTNAASGDALSLRLRPITGWCDPPPSVLAEAIDRGAAIVVSAGASCGTASAALEPDAADPADLSVVYRVEAGGYALVALESRIDAELVDAFRRSIGGADVDVLVREVDDATLLRMESSSLPALRQAARRGDLFFDRLPAPMNNYVVARNEVYQARVRRDLFEFAPDVRPLDEWVDS